MQQASTPLQSPSASSHFFRSPSDIFGIDNKGGAKVNDEDRRPQMENDESGELEAGDGIFVASTTQLAGNVSILTDQSVPDLGPTADTSEISQYLLAEQQTKSRKGVTVTKDAMNTVNTAILSPLRTERHHGPHVCCAKPPPTI